MDHYSILDQSSASAVAEGDLPGSSASRSQTRSVSAGIAAANALLTKPAATGARFPGEDSGRSLADMAHRDLDAALQLLAERAQYITGASGTAIALRRGAHHDMLCRACIGPNAPELGALLSMEYGLSGESVRTRQVLSCEDAERDPRVNRDVCRELGIASVVVLPIGSEEQVLGVFELLSGTPRAFSERDLAALRRLGEMVETAVKHSAASQVMPVAPDMAPAQSQPQVGALAAPAPQLESIPRAVVATPSAPLGVPLPKQEAPPPQRAAAPPVPKKALFWSAAMRVQGSGPVKKDADTIAVPPVLRNLQKCQACGFPVSQGRTFCVECEEKQWRGQRLPQPAAGPEPDEPPQLKAALREVQGTFLQDFSSAQVSVPATEPATASPTIPPVVSASDKPDLASQLTQSSINQPVALLASTPSFSEVPADVPASDNTAPFLSSALQSQSWFAANKYILGALLVVAIVIAAIALLR